jgi:hypothetical protein
MQKELIEMNQTITATPIPRYVRLLAAAIVFVHAFTVMSIVSGADAAAQSTKGKQDTRDKGTPDCSSVWTIYPSPNVGSSENFLNGVAAVSSNDYWAVGYYYNPQLNAYRTLIEHWNGSSWSVVTSPNASSYNHILNDVTVVSANDIWAVGFYMNGPSGGKTLTLHYNGTDWYFIPSTN